MATMNETTVRIAYNNAFPGGKNLNGVAIPWESFKGHWVGKDDTKLRDALRADKYAGGVYKTWRDKQKKTTTTAPKPAPSAPKASGSANYEKDLNHLGDATKQKTMAGWGWKWEWTNKAKNQGTYAPTTAAAKAKYKTLYGKNYVSPVDASKTKPIPSKPAPKPSDPLADIINKLDKDNKAIIDSAKNLLDETIKRGQVINPDVEITPEKAAEFLKKAEGEINPYYSTQLKLARESLLTDAGYDIQQIENFERDLEKQYIRSFRGIGEGAAEAGFAQSGIRKREEGELMEGTQQQIQDTRGALEQQVGTLSRAFAQQYAGLPGYQQPDFKMAGAPSIGTNPQGTIGSFAKPTTQQSVYSLSPDIYSKLIGSSEFERRGALSGRQSELESAWRTTEANKQLRQLTL